MAGGIIWSSGPDLDAETNNPVVMRAHDESENLLYEIRFGGSAFGDYPYVFIARPDGRIYVGLSDFYADPRKTPNDYFRIYHQEGYRIDFPSLHGRQIFSLHIDSSENIYVGGLNNSADSYYVARKYDSAGSLQWSRKSRNIPDSTGKSVKGIVQDTSGNLYFLVSGYYSELSKYSSAGVHQWTQVFPHELIKLAIDSSDNLYLAGKYNTGYYQSETFSFSDFLYNITFYDVELGTYSGSGGHAAYNILKFDDAGNLIGALYTGIITQDFKIVNDFLYIFSDGFFKYSTALVQQSFTGPSFQSPAYPSPSWFAINPDDETVYTAAYSRPIAVFYTADPILPALPLPMYFGIPSWVGDYYASIPALALPFTLRAPVAIREYTGASPPSAVYRCYLTGDPGTIELLMSSFSCRRGYGSLTLTVVCPGLDDANVQAIEDRIDGNLIIRRGIRLPDGGEQLDDLFVAPLAGLRWDTGSASASATLDAVSSDPTNAKVRILRGISYRNLSGGKRRVRCAVDTWLQPGDTADLGGGETMTVGELVYNVSPESETMEVLEAA